MNGPINYSQYASHYETVGREIVDQPKQVRPCTDICCTVTFLVLIGGLIGAGIYQMSEYNSLSVNGMIVADLQDEFQLSSYWTLLVGAGGISVVTAFLYVFLIKMFPDAMVKTMMVLSLALLAAITVYALIQGQIWVAVSTGLTLAIYLLVLVCLRHKIKLGIILVKIATKFITDKMYIFMTPVIKLLLTCIFGAFWVYTFNCIIEVMQNKQVRKEDDSLEIVLIAFWMLMWLTTVFVFYYMMTFTIAVICSHWYYRLNERNTIITAYKWMFKQFGSLVFGALILAVVTLARMFARENARNQRNIVAAICMAIVACLLKAIEDLLQILNHYTVIVITLTGQGYIEGAKSTMGLLYSQLGLMSISNIICNFLVFWGLIISVGIPTLISYFYLASEKHITDDQIGQMIGIIIIICILMSTIVYEIITEAVSCIYIFYAADKGFVSMGLIAQHRFPQQSKTQLQNYDNRNPYAQQQQNSYGRL